MQDGVAVIAKGLTAGEKIVVDGQYRLTQRRRGSGWPRPSYRRGRMTPLGIAHEQPTFRRRPAAMSISEPFIRRPIATSLLMLGILVFGIAAYNLLPVAALPRVDFPTIVGQRQLSRRQPGSTMASSVATPLEQKFAAIPGSPR